MWARAADHARKKVWFSICVERRGKGQISALQKMSPPWAFNTAPEAQFAVGLPIPPSRLRRATVPQFNMVASLRAQSALAMFPVSLGSSHRPALRWPGIPGLRSASRCPHPFTPSGLRRLRPVSRTARGLRAPRLRRPSVPALRTALAFGGAVFRRCGRLLGVSSRLQPLRGLCLRTACARASSRFAASNGQRPGRECIFTFRTDPQFSMVVPHLRTALR